MCLGVPGRITSIEEADAMTGGADAAERADVRMGRVDFGGVARRVCLAHVPGAVVGDYVLVHVGFALTRLDEDEAHRVLALLRELGQLEDLGPEPDLGDGP